MANELYSTTGQEDVKYTTDAYEENKATGNIDPPVVNPYVFGTTVNYNPKKGISHAPAMSGFTRDVNDINRYDEAWQGEDYGSLDKYRVDTQSGLNKGFNSVVGGILMNIKRMKDFILRNRKFYIKTRLFELEIDYNLIPIIIIMLILFLLIDTCIFAYWLGWFIYK